MRVIPLPIRSFGLAALHIRLSAYTQSILIVTSMCTQVGTSNPNRTSCLVLSCLVLSCLSCLVLLVLSCIACLVLYCLSCLVLLVLSCIACLVLFCLVLSCLFLSSHVVFCRVVFHTIPYCSASCRIRSYPILSYLNSCRRADTVPH